MSIVEFKNVSYSYPGTETQVLKNISFSVEKGEFIGVLGSTGAGKTTLSLTLCGLIPTVSGGILEGEVLLNNFSTKEESLETILESAGEGRALFGITFQDSESQIVGMSVEEDIAFGLENAGISPEEINDRTEESLKSVNMSEYRKTYSYALSGGQKQRISIASALALRPEVLILDEPTSELDPIGRAEVFRIIQNLKEKTNLTIIMVEHEIEELVKYANRFLLLDEGEIVLDTDANGLIENVDLLLRLGIRIPEISELGVGLKNTLNTIIPPLLNEKDAYDTISKLINKKEVNL